MNPDILNAWAIKHHVGFDALAELRQLYGHVPQVSTEVVPLSRGKGETFVQSQVRLAAPAHGVMLYRNNVGAIKDERGVPVRYGLANDTAALNKVVKSADLIGWRTVDVRDLETGAPIQIAQFVSVECKKPEWPGYNPSDEHERAQQRWLEMVVGAGGFAVFANGPQIEGLIK
jgi:hypothetical protein